MNKLMPWHTVILVWIKKMVGIIDVKKKIGHGWIDGLSRRIGSNWK